MPLNELRGEFHGWLERYAHRTNPWPDFEVHLRKVLRRVCDAGDVHAFHVMHNPHRLCPLQRSTPRESMALLASVAEVTDRVVQSIESFHGCVGDANGSPSREDKAPAEPRLRRAARAVPPHPDWSFPIVHDWHLAGVVTVGTLPVWIRRDLTLLRSLAEAVNEQWRYVADVCRWRCDWQADHRTCVMTRAKFLEHAPRVGRQSGSVLLGGDVSGLVVVPVPAAVAKGASEVDEKVQEGTCAVITHGDGVASEYHTEEVTR